MTTRSVNANIKLRFIFALGKMNINVAYEIGAIDNRKKEVTF